jgi:hypothetical protein
MCIYAQPSQPDAAVISSPPLQPSGDHNNLTTIDMRLINTTTRAFEEFIGQNIPQYAILSHTWEEDEVSYKDYTQGWQVIRRMKGYAKIDMTCRIAAKEGIQYAWIDTCCIDKRSSAELTEAINSMFRWYEKADVCYAFLSDLFPHTRREDTVEAMQQCRWYVRLPVTTHDMIALSTDLRLPGLLVAGRYRSCLLHATCTSTIRCGNV